MFYYNECSRSEGAHLTEMWPLTGTSDIVSLDMFDYSS